MPEARQLDRIVGDLDADQPAAERQAEGLEVGETDRSAPIAGVSDVSASAPARTSYWARRVKTNEAPNAWAVRNKVPTFIDLLGPSMPMPK